MLFRDMMMQVCTAIIEERGRSGVGGVKEGGARAVLRDAWQKGHQCVELRRDGRRLIFFCTRCTTRCYSDSALWDHLNGNLHSRQAVLVAERALSPSLRLDDTGSGENRVGSMPPSEKPQQLLTAPMHGCHYFGRLPSSSLEWLGCCQLLLSESSSSRLPQVQAAWCQWFGRNNTENSIQFSELAASSAYAVIIFPYSDVIGRSGDWKPIVTAGNSLQSGQKPSELDDWNTKNKNFQLIRARRLHQSCKDSQIVANEKQLKNDAADAKIVGLNRDSIQKGEESAKLPLSRGLSNRALRRALKKQRVQALERLCFLCHQKMLPGRDVAALFNPQTCQMMCSSRNRHGAFHVFHTLCLIDWILLCGVKFWIAPSICSKSERRKIKNQTYRNQDNTRAATCKNNGAIFCPECQGTGVQISGTELEHPRYRLSQVFGWILELIEARKAWSGCPYQWKKDTAGLLFGSNKEQGTVLSVGFVHFYSSGSPEFVPATSFVKNPTLG